MVEYWFPYRDVITGQWEEALRRALPKIATAQTRAEYERELMALIARVEDTHSNLWSSLASRPPAGACQLPVSIRFVEGAPTVAAGAGELRAGDVIAELDGAPVRE